MSSLAVPRGFRNGLGAWEWKRLRYGGLKRIMADEKKKRPGLPLATVKRLFREALKESLGDAAGVEKVRLSDDAMQMLVKYLEELIRKIAPLAYEIASNAKRKTIRREDIETAIKALKSSM